MADNGAALVCSGTGGMSIVLKYVSPKEVGRLAWERWRSLRFARSQALLEPRRVALGGSGRERCQQLVSGVAHTKWFVGKARSLALRLLAGVAPTSAWLHHHGWATDGLCACGREDTVAHKLAGCSLMSGRPVQSIRSYKDFWALMTTPEIPARIHPSGFLAAWCLGALVDEEQYMYFGSGAVYSDGSVKWPRWKVTAT